MKSLLVPLVSSIAKHDALVASSEIFLCLVSVHRRCDIDILSLNHLNNFTSVAVKALCPVIVANSFAGISGNLFEVDFLFGATGLAHETENLRFNGTLHGDLGIGVYS